MKFISTSSIRLIEDHHEAYFIWREKGFRRKILVHVDAHVDFGFFDTSPSLPLAISESRNKEDLIRRLEKHLAFARHGLDYDRSITIANYIYPAMRDGIVDVFYWVIPDKNLPPVMSLIKKLKKKFSRHDPYLTDLFECRKDKVHMTLYGKDFYICTLKGLPKIGAGALLDVDVDFLVMKSIKESTRTQKIGDRKSWITPWRLVSILRNKVPGPLYTTIAYSVNEGYTPIVYKTLGDRIYLEFTGKAGAPRVAKKLLAHSYFMRSETLYKKRQPALAQRAYLKAIHCDPSYGAADNNLGPLFLLVKKLGAAEREFNKILSHDPENPHALCGLGEIAFAKKKFKISASWFKKSLAVRPDLPKALLGLAGSLYPLGEFEKSEFFAKKFLEGNPLRPEAYRLLSGIHLATRNFEELTESFKKTLISGGEDGKLYSRIFKLMKEGVIKENDWRFFRDKYASYGQNKRFEFNELESKS